MAGGVGAYTAELGKALVAGGASVSVLTSRQARAEQTGDGSDGVEHTGDDGIVRYPQVDRWHWLTAHIIAYHAERIGADWIHVQYQTAAYNMNPAINLAPRIWHTRHWRSKAVHTAWTYHDLLVPYLFPKAGEPLREWVTEQPARYSDLTVVTNEGDRLALKNRLAQRPSNAAAKRAPHQPDAPVLIPIGSNIQGRVLSAAERAAQRQAYGYRDDHVVIGYFGFLNRSKGGETLIRTLRELVKNDVNAHLLMIGERIGASDPTNTQYLREVATLIEKLEVTERIQWTGRLASDAVAGALNACDVLFMPYEDGASLRRGTLMAGLANGCAIVTTTPQVPVPQLVNGQDLLFVPPGAPKVAARAIQRVIHTPELARALRQNAHTLSQRFTWDRIAAQHLALYEKILQRGKSR